jgi:dihydrofolate reductase
VCAGIPAVKRVDAAADQGERCVGGRGRDDRDAVRAFLAADLIDRMHIVVVPIVLGRGVRLWDGLDGIEERFDVEATASPSGVTHLVFTRRPRR